MCANGIWPKQQENKIKDETKQNAAAAVRKTHRESRISLLSYAIVGSFCTTSATSLKLSLVFDNHGGGGWRGKQGKIHHTGFWLAVRSLRTPLVGAETSFVLIARPPKSLCEDLEILLKTHFRAATHKLEYKQIK